MILLFSLEFKYFAHSFTNLQILQMLMILYSEYTLNYLV